MYKLLSCLFLFFIWCCFVVLQRQHQVFFLLKKRKIQDRRIYLFLTSVSKSLPLLDFLKTLNDVHKKPYPVSAWEEKMSYSLPGKTEKKSLFFPYTLDSRQIKATGRLRLEGTSASHLIQPFTQSRAKFRSGCSGSCPIKFWISPQIVMMMKSF